MHSTLQGKALVNSFRDFVMFIWQAPSVLKNEVIQNPAEV